MSTGSIHNRKWLAWLLSAAFVLMTLPSVATWQCLDGHACPPGCTMQHMGENAKANGSSSPRSCCLLKNSKEDGSQHCALCTSANSKNSLVKERCTSPMCVLRTIEKPDSSATVGAHFVFHLDTNSVLLPAASYTLVPEETVTISFGSSRAPPDRLFVRVSSPRAPPVCLA